MWQVNGPRPCSAGRLAQQEYALHPINGASCRRGLLRAVIAASITGIVILTGLLLMPLIKGRDGCQFAKTARRYLAIGEPTVRPAAADEATASPAPDLAEFGTKCVRIVHRTNEPEPIVPNGFGVNLFAPGRHGFASSARCAHRGNIFAGTARGMGRNAPATGSFACL
jgi:hypothetical protein